MQDLRQILRDRAEPTAEGVKPSLGKWEFALFHRPETQDDQKTVFTRVSVRQFDQRDEAPRTTLDVAAPRGGGGHYAATAFVLKWDVKDLSHYTRIPKDIGDPTKGWVDSALSTDDVSAVIALGSTTAAASASTATAISPAK
jgi:hypothetical protein